MASFAAPSDFADWLSPMLVKELRQGVRSRVFMTAFYLTQGFMILCVIFSLVAAGDGQNRSAFGFLTGLFWFLIGVPLILLMPLRGFGALYGEIKNGTLELVFLTRLSALRIAAGKWMALMVQTLLLVCSVLPYVLLRYFLGGVNVVDDLQNLVFLLFISGMLTAVTVAVSPYESRILRAFFSVGSILAVVVLIPVVVNLLVMSRTGGAFRSATSMGLVWAGAVLFVPAFIFLCLEIAASRIAPPAENHALTKRLIGLYFLPAAAVWVFLGASFSVAAGLAMLCLAVVIIDALAEPHQFVRSTRRAFLRWGRIGQPAALMLTPGWVSASWFLLPLALLGGGLLWLQGQAAETKEVLKCVAFLGGLIFPAALIRLFAPGTRFFLAIYLALQFFFVVLTVLVAMMGSFSRESLVLALTPIPTCTFLMGVFNSHEYSQHVSGILGVTMAITLGSLGILLARTITPLRDIRRALSQTPRQDV
jgi:hypothetical protein